MACSIDGDYFASTTDPRCPTVLLGYKFAQSKVTRNMDTALDNEESGERDSRLYLARFDFHQKHGAR